MLPKSCAVYLKNNKMSSASWVVMTNPRLSMEAAPSGDQFWPTSFWDDLKWYEKCLKPQQRCTTIIAIIQMMISNFCGSEWLG